MVSGLALLSLTGGAVQHVLHTTIFPRVDYSVPTLKHRRGIGSFVLIELHSAQ